MIRHQHRMKIEEGDGGQLFSGPVSKQSPEQKLERYQFFTLDEALDPRSEMPLEVRRIEVQGDPSGEIPEGLVIAAGGLGQMEEMIDIIGIERDGAHET